MTQPMALEMRNITKVYPNGVVANQNVQLSCKVGEIHALMGENGAGKSTLMKILFGAEKATQGEIFVNGKEAHIQNPMDAIRLGIGMVHQHFMLDEKLTVMENIILGMEPKKGLRLDRKKANEMVEEISKKYHLGVDPKSMVADLDVSKKQKVEILKSLIRGAKILILDEPTAVLTPQETDELFEQLKELRRNGHTIIFISHKLKEIKAICDHGTILRSGKTVGEFAMTNVTIPELSSLMVGREVVQSIAKEKHAPGETVLEVKNIAYTNEEDKEVLKNVSLKVRRGQILGIAGVEGNGQREFVDCITGIRLPEQGEIYLNGQKCRDINATKDRREKGMTHIPEDRMAFGVMAEASIEDNLISNRFNSPEFNRGLFLNEKKMRELSDKLIKAFEVKTDSRETPIKMLSGGNMQKVVAAREMSVDMDVLVADQPTRGIDVGTAALIHQQMVEKRDQGVGVLLVSADMNEVLELSDSLVVFYDGEITAYFEDASILTEEELGLYMLGIERMTMEQMEGVLA